MDKLIINMLGEFSISYNDAELRENTRSKKLWMLIEYIVAYRGGTVAQTELFDILWGEDGIDNPANTLKALIHRARLMLSELGLNGKKLISCRQGAYYLNTDEYELSVDTDRFEDLLNKAEASEGETKLNSLMDAIALYKGGFLPQMSMESWVVPISIFYHTKYIMAVKEVIGLLQAEERHNDIITICQKAVAIDPYDEVLHNALVRALFASGNARGAIDHYEYVTDLLYSHFGVTPSAEFVALYREIIKSTNAVEHDLSVIKTSLSEKGRVGGAYYCEYETFKDIYHLELRTQARTGQIFCLCLLSLTSGSVPKSSVPSVMKKLEASIRESLRKDDIFTRFSVTQYLLMLPGTTLENAEPVAQRIVRNLRRANTRSSAEVTYRLQPMAANEQ